MTAHTLGQWCRLLFGGLAQAGVTDVVLSPGSRSTPLVLAASRQEGLRLHRVIDERCAAFFALGQARMTGWPTVLVCTSGTAGAHYWPAVMEAKASRVPLVVLTADRPFELHDCRAPQTVDQQRLFGHHGVGFFELGHPEASDGSLRAVRRMASQAVLTALHPIPGAVQINVRAKKPLEPVEAETAEERTLEDRVDALLHRPVVACAPRWTPEDAALDAAASLIQSAPKTLIAAGPGPVRAPEATVAFADSVFQLAVASGAPVVPEAASQLRFGPAPERVVRADAYDVLLRDPGRWPGLVPDVLVQVGGPLTSAPWLRFLAAHPETRRVILTEGPWADPDSAADVLVVGETTQTLRGLAQRLQVLRPFQPSTGWASDRSMAWRAVATLLEDQLALSEGSAVRTLVNALPEHGVLMLGNSLPIRHVETFCPAMNKSVQVVVQRGVNGIDGLISGAAGAATASGQPTMLIVGDVSFLHDVGGLHAASTVEGPLVIAVLNNGGGRIFEMLPVARVPNAPLDHFTTPHDQDLAALVRGYGVAYASVDTPAALADAVQDAVHRPKATVLDIHVPPHGAIDMLDHLTATIKETGS